VIHGARSLVRARTRASDQSTSGLEMPAIRGKRDRIVSPEQAVTLLAAAQGNNALTCGRPRWYAGLALR